MGGPPPPRRRRKGLVIGVVVGVILFICVIATAATLAVVTLSTPSDAERIASVTKDFVDRLDTNQTTRASECLCEEQARMYLEDAQDEQLTPVDAREDGSGVGATVTVSNIQVRGSVASATVASRSVSDLTVYYRKVGDDWKICDQAMSQFQQAK